MKNLEDFKKELEERKLKSRVEVFELFLNNFEKHSKKSDINFVHLSESLKLFPDKDEPISFEKLLTFTINYFNSLLNLGINNHPVHWMYYRLEKMLLDNRPSGISRATIFNLFHIIKREEIYSFNDFLDFIAGDRILIPISRKKKIYISTKQSVELLQNINRSYHGHQHFYNIEEFIHFMEREISIKKSDLKFNKFMKHATGEQGLGYIR